MLAHNDLTISLVSLLHVLLGFCASTDFLDSIGFLYVIGSLSLLRVIVYNSTIVIATIEHVKNVSRWTPSAYTHRLGNVICLAQWLQCLHWSFKLHWLQLGIEWTWHIYIFVVSFLCCIWRTGLQWRHWHHWSNVFISFCCVIAHSGFIVFADLKKQRKSQTLEIASTNSKAHLIFFVSL